MEKITDFDQWVMEYVPPKVEYVAVYDPNTGIVSSVGPSHAFVDEKYKVPVDHELAESIINAEVKISSCVVNINSHTIEVAEVKNVYKIDDVLHRIISKEYSDSKSPEVYLTHNLEKKTLRIELSEEFGGTRKPEIAVKKRKVVWDGDTEMHFLITDYNDPNLLFETISVKINELAGKAKTIKFNHSKFSVYTRRLFKNYVIEYK